GTSGRQVTLKANYFRLETHTNWCLYQYRVDFAPEEDRTVVRKGLLRNHKPVLGGYIFDGTMMFTSHRLNPDPMELFSTRESDKTPIRITVRLVGDLTEGDYHYIQFFNILMRKALGYLQLQLVGRNFFDALAKIVVPKYNLELWPGYLTSIRQHETNILMCSEITHKVMRQDTVLELLTECVQRGERRYKELFKQAIIGAVVLTDYNNRTYRVDDVDFDVTPSSTFELRRGEQVSYIDYYLRKYQRKIYSVDQPLLVTRTKAREQRAGQDEFVYLVPELCRMTGLTDEMRGNFNVMRDLAEHTRVGPQGRMDRLNAFNRRLLKEQNVRTDLLEWNMRLADKLIEFQGRVLPQEKILQGGHQGQEVKYDAGPLTDWTKELRSNPMLVIPALNNWVVICPNRLRRDAQNFVSTLVRAAQGMRFVIPQPYFCDIPDDRASSFVQALEQVISSRDPQMIMCIVTNNRLDRYAAIKKKCCVDRAVPTQVIVARSLTAKSVMSIATKVAIQMSCKIGGAPWTVEIPLSGLMVVGFDVCHDTTTKEKSYGALVASLDKPFSRYFSAVSAHTTGEELSNYLTSNIAKALHKYKEYNGGALPQRIVIYRDGVGEGQIPYVYKHEVELLKERLNIMYGSQPVRMAFIVVTKRINTRLFLGNGNPPPGTVADDCITMPYDFFLVSQSVRQGTVSPTSYNVISDNVGLDPDKLQRLTYKLTHLYFNWSGTVRVPAPCQYAHKLAYLVGQALHNAPSSRLEDLLYFL
ncbi:Protein piwi, partial [Zootermopsis nevadensis]